MEIQQESVSIASIIASIKKLKAFADDKYKEIEDFYRHDDSGRVFYSPMNVPAGNVGGNNRGDMLLQQNAFFVAKRYYLAFLNHQHPTELLDKLVALHQENPLVSLSAIKDTGAPLADRFFPDYQRFMQDIEKLQSDLKQVTLDETAWRDYFNTMFKEHAINLIQKHNITRTSFTSTVESIKPKLTHPPETLDVDIDYFYQLSKTISPTMCSINTSLKDGSIRTTSNILSSLEDYLVELKYTTSVELFQQVFEENYYGKEYETACKQALSTQEGEMPRWTVEQLRKPKSKNHETQQPEQSNSQKEEDENPNRLN